MSLTNRVKNISPPQTLELNAIANSMRQQGMDVIGFAAGESDFDTPDHIKAAGIKAIESNFTRYTAAAGTKELREAISNKLKLENGLDYTPEQVIVSTGAKQSLYNALMVLCEVGDEVIIPSPYWLSYPEMVGLAGGLPVYINPSAETDYKITADHLRESISKKTKLLILNSPNNPTGAVYSERELRDIAELCVEHGIYIIADEIYEKFVYEGEKHISIAAFDEEVKKLTITINGVSKAYAMTGWRIGYAAAEKEIIKAMSALQGHTTSSPVSISQMASYQALTGNQEVIGEMVKQFDERRRYIVKALKEIPGIGCSLPKGAFYVFPEVEGLIGKTLAGVKIKDGNDFAKLILEKVQVVVVPGSVFGSSSNLRLSYATSMEKIKLGMQRVKDFVEKA